MKYILLLIICLTNSKLYSQISLTEMIAVYKMNFDQFETFSLKKGFHFSKMEDEENFTSVSYTKGQGVGTKYIQLYTKFFADGKNVTLQTSVENDYLSIKEQASKMGFKLIETENYKGSLRKVYKKDSWKITAYSTADESGTDYEISLRKDQ
jgi:hypothetical protein